MDKNDNKKTGFYATEDDDFFLALDKGTYWTQVTSRGFLPRQHSLKKLNQGSDRKK